MRIRAVTAGETAHFTHMRNLRALHAFVVAVLAIVLLAGCTHPKPAPAAPTRTEAAVDLEAKTIALVMRNDEGRVRPFCTGVWVSPTSILTAAHCVDDEQIGDPFEYVAHGDVFAPGELHERPSVMGHGCALYDVDAEHDLALLRASDAPAHAVAHVSLATIHAGDFAQAMGHSLGLWWSYSSGDISAVRERPINDLTLVWVQATTPISPGNSGGGLFDDRGRLIGIAHGAFPRGENLNVFVHAQYLDALLRRQVAL